MSPEVADDLFLAHLAVYDFAGGLAVGRRVLDLGCGTGYGSAHLLAAGAVAVDGIDTDEASLAYARRRFAAPRLRFVRGRAEAPSAALAAGAGPFGLIVAANLLAHLANPEAAVAAAAGMLTDTGIFLASVPPIVDDRTMDQHRGSALHASNLYLWDWESLLGRYFSRLRLHRLLTGGGAQPDLSDPARSRLALADFRIEEVPLSQLDEAGTLAAIFCCSTPRAESGPVQPGAG